MRRARPSEPRPVAVIGELIALQAKVRGAAAILVDGPVRDVDEIAAFGLPVWARSLSAAGPAKDVPGELDVPVDGRRHPDRAGRRRSSSTATGSSSCRVPAVEEVLAAAEARAAKERHLGRRLEAGELTLDLMGLRE